MKDKRTKRILRITASILAGCCLLGGVVLLSLNAYVKHTTEDAILSAEEAALIADADCILVLGCQVKADGVPSHMLEDRLRRGVELYQLEASPKLLMSGDHGQEEYNEVATMKKYAVDAGIPDADVFMDHAGFSTYESLYRAKEIFGADKLIIVSQKYHLYRALYIAEELGIEAYGVDADYRTYWGQTKREVREILARCKDLLTTAFRVSPTYGGEAIPISGDGNQTNDSYYNDMIEEE